MKEKDIIKDIIEKHLKSNLIQLDERQEKEDRCYYYGYIMGKISMLPDIVAKFYKDDDTNAIVVAFSSIYDYVNYSFYHSKEDTMPNYYKYIKKVLYEEGKSE